MVARDCDILPTTSQTISVVESRKSDAASKGCFMEPDCFDRGIFIPDDLRIPKDTLMIQPYYSPLIDHILIPKGMIVDRIEKIAQDIHNYYTYQRPTRELNLVCTLKGAVMFFEHLTRFLRAFSRYDPIDLGRPTYIEHYIKASSYSGMTRECTVELGQFSPSAAGSPTSKRFFKNKDVVIVEDILDSGNTLREIKRALHDEGVNSVCSAVLFTKR
eukprot:Protomagalhaensia_sp_Gyna_25__5998@NODE_938_length_2381_cov_324_278822_g744_i0_p2_GENE_NODE_938_length_2381_cov_324_278822_g744_i0NODE_938_length_2381_cov_324_278822_g744_i0_p2_ORF_typecomplete_len216_score20_33Pribosyltran/PF00156_27/1_7e15PRTase_3/PF15610_6/0_005Pribosyl_synth/PF14572_6/0_0098PRTase_2/PF15609_6/0_087_NODE_938_length_2381_cov_324_278822_g744_i014462093